MSCSMIITTELTVLKGLLHPALLSGLVLMDGNFYLLFHIWIDALLPVPCPGREEPTIAELNNQIMSHIKPQLQSLHSGLGPH